MRLLLINPNTSAAVTDNLVAEALHHAADGTEIIGATAAFGAPFITTPAQSSTAAKAVVDLVDGLPDIYDAIILAAFSDPGLAEARALARVPVLGIAESALLTARMIGPRFSIVTLGPAMRPLIEAAVRRAGCTDLLVDLHMLDTPDVAADQVQEAYGATLAELCRAAAEGGEVSSIVLGGGPLAGLARHLNRTSAVPLLDGTACAVRHAETLVALGAGRSGRT
ncbi:MAG TPA: aspartate/glutamate racemase family protein [Stellaceae bacterium]|nr:aspartate/glutamate racemase family protein [Stellaceae bacterium]